MPVMVRLALIVGLAVAWPLAFGCVKPSDACLINGDCASGLQCIAGRCQVPSQPECGDRDRCGADSECATGACANGCCLPPCGADEDCGDTEECRAGVCRDIGAPCTSNAECSHNPSAPVCDLQSGSCVRCTRDRHCGTGQACINNGCKGSSVTGCVQDADCDDIPQLARCHADIGLCVACLEDTDCSDDGSVFCDLSTHACSEVREGCGWDGDCIGSPAGPRCRRDNTCVECLLDKDCADDERCNPQTNRCTMLPGCSTNANCAAPKPFCRQTDRTCTECLTNGHCPTGEVCKTGYCVPAQNGCAVPEHCAPPTPTCRTSDETCVGCVFDRDCNGRLCEDTRCVSCSGDADCRRLSGRPFCTQGTCVACIADRDCGSSGLVCEGGLCTRDMLDQLCPSDGSECGHGLVCVQDVANPGGVCRKPCDFYGTGSECPGDRRCALVKFQSGLPMGACLPRADGRAGLGEACTAARPCQIDLHCVPEGPGESRCRDYCDPNRGDGSCRSPNRCQWLATLDPQRIPRALGVCFADSKFNKPCTSDASCDPGQVCAARPNPAAPLTYTNLCVWPEGAGGPGAPCSTDSDCRTGLCLQGMPTGQGKTGFCQGGCQQDADCPSRPDGLVDGACSSFPLSWRSAGGQPVEVQINTCVPQCRDETECRSTETCAVRANVQQTSWVRMCRPANALAPDALGGEPCGADSDCRSGRCHRYGPSSAGLCEAACTPENASASCAEGAQCPEGGIPRAVGPGRDGIPGNGDDPIANAPVCAGKECLRDASCGPGGACGTDPDPDSPYDVLLSCRPRQGSKIGGALCSSDGECRTGWCVTWSGGARCFGGCRDAADCDPGARCATTKLSAQSTRSLSMCVPR